MTNAETVWSFEIGRARVVLEIEPEYGYQYDGDDEDGETQAQLDSGELVAFQSAVRVFWIGAEIGTDYLGGSVYRADDVADFYTAHRDPDPMNRNCTIMRAQHPAGPRVSICHYFPGMVSEAISEARKWLADACSNRRAA